MLVVHSNLGVLLVGAFLVDSVGFSGPLLSIQVGFLSGLFVVYFCVVLYVFCFVLSCFVENDLWH